MADENVTTLPKGQSMPNIMTNVKQAKQKALKDSYEQKLKGLVDKAQEHKKALKQIEEQITDVTKEFEQEYIELA